MKIKVCGMRDKENIEALLQLKPDYVGFIFYPLSPRYVRHFPDIEWPEGTKKVGVFVNEPLEDIRVIALQNGIRTLQLHGDESPEICQNARVMGFEVIKAFNVHEAFDFRVLDQYKPVVNYFLFDATGPRRGGNGTSFNWEILRQYDQQVPYFLSGGIGPLHAEVMKSDWLDVISPFAIDVNSRFELSPGVKNINQLDDFIRTVRN